MIDPRSGRTERRRPLALIATSVDTRFGASAGTPRDECFHSAGGWKRTIALDQAQLRHLTLLAVDPGSQQADGAVEVCIDGTRKRVVARTDP
jgi:hypothetical protein